MRTTLDLSDETFRQLKAQAALSGLKLKDLVTQFIERGLAAAALRSSKPTLGAYFRRMSARMDKPKAVAAAAHKLARLIYTMLTKGEEYTDQGQD